MEDENLVETDYPWMKEEDTISQAYPILEGNDIIFLKDGRSLKGAVLRSHLMKAKISPDAKMKTFKTHPPTVEEDTPIGEVARLMVENDIFQIPVLEKDEIKGVVDGDRIIRKATEGDFGKEIAGELMTDEIRTVGPDESVSNAERIMKEMGISRLPVVEEGKLMGMITMDDLLTNLYHPEHRPRGTNASGDGSKYGDRIAEKKDYLNLPVSGLMTEEVITMSPGSRVRSVVQAMDKMKFRGMLLKGEDGKLGMITRKDLIRPIAEYLKPRNLEINFSGELHQIEDFDREEARSEILDHIGMHEQFLGNSEIRVLLKRHKETLKGVRKIFCEIRLTSSNGRYVATDEGWGFAHAIRNTTEALEKQVRREKEDIRDR